MIDKKNILSWKDRVKRCGYLQKDVANIMGINEEDICKYFNNKRGISLRRYEEIERIVCNLEKNNKIV